MSWRSLFLLFCLAGCAAEQNAYQCASTPHYSAFSGGYIPQCNMQVVHEQDTLR